MNEEEAIYTESCLKQHNEEIEHASRMELLIQQEEFNLFAILKPSLQIDGNQYCVLYGDNLQVGIAGFGDSPHSAIIDFNKNWYKSIK